MVIRVEEQTEDAEDEDCEDGDDGAVARMR